MNLQAPGRMLKGPIEYRIILLDFLFIFLTKLDLLTFGDSSGTSTALHQTTTVITIIVIIYDADNLLRHTTAPGAYDSKSYIN